jgi:hypothetical protein
MFIYGKSGKQPVRLMQIISSTLLRGYLLEVTAEP